MSTLHLRIYVRHHEKSVEMSGHNCQSQVSGRFRILRGIFVPNRVLFCSVRFLILLPTAQSAKNFRMKLSSMYYSTTCLRGGNQAIYRDDTTFLFPLTFCWQVTFDKSSMLMFKLSKLTTLIIISIIIFFSNNIHLSISIGSILFLCNPGFLHLFFCGCDHHFAVTEA